MKSLPDSETALAELGDKVVEAIARAVGQTRSDLAEYRAWRPEFVARHSNRGLANWIHDHLWYHLLVILDGVPGVDMQDDGTTREIAVGLNYRLRIKRHHPDGRVSTYATPTALDFLDQPIEQLVFEGMEEVRLIAGYEWVEDSHDIGAAVISMRDGNEVILWQVEVTEVAAEVTSATPVRSTAEVPPTPTVEVSDGIVQGGNERRSE